MINKTKATDMKEDDQPALVPKLRFPEFRDAAGWEEETLSGVATVVMGSSPKSECYNQSQTGLPLLQGNADIKNRLSAPRIFTSEITKECTIGDILLSVRAPVGSVAKSIHHACIGRGIAAVRADQPNSQEFVYQWLLSYEPQWGNISQGGTFDAVNSDDLKGVAFAVPRPAEQQKIAECLSSVDELIAAQARKLDALKTHKKGLMQQLFPREGETQPRLRFPEFQNAGEWEEKQVGEVFKVTRGEVLSMTLVQDEKTSEARFPVYSSQTKKNGLSGYYSDFLYEDAITWTTDGANAGDVNYRSGKFYCTNVCGVLINTDGYANPCVAALINSVSRNHVSYVGNPKLMNGVMAKITIPFPKVEEQKRIADCLTSLDDLIATQTQKLDALKTHKKGLMQQLFPSPVELEA